jgi:hypothetical protein
MILLGHDGSSPAFQSPPGITVSSDSMVLQFGLIAAEAFGQGTARGKHVIGLRGAHVVRGAPVRHAQVCEVPLMHLTSAG